MEISTDNFSTGDYSCVVVKCQREVKMDISVSQSSGSELNRSELFVEGKQPIHFSWYKKAIMSDHLLFRQKT